MTIFELILTSIALAMDCLAVSIVCGLAMKKIDFWPMMRIAFFFGLFQALMPCIGWLCGSQVNRFFSHIDHWIAFGILLFLGVRMIVEDLRGSDDDNKTVNPYRLKMVVTMAVATSIDALAVGLSLPMLDVSLLQTVSVIGITSFVLSWVGMLLSVLVGKLPKLRAEMIGGIILIIIGLRIIVEHLVSAM